MKENHSLKMYIFPYRILAIFCCVLFLVSAAGCDDVPEIGGKSSEIPSSEITPVKTVTAEEIARIHSLLENAKISGPVNPHESAGSNDTFTLIETTWDSPKPLIDFSTGLTPEIRNDEEFNFFMEHYLSRRETNFSFYACDGFTINNDVLLYRFSLPYVSTTWTQMEDNKVYWEIYITYYPGTCIADAYLSGDTSALSEDEKKVYDMAKDFIENTVNKEKSFLQKERLIHDYICENCVYTNPKTDQKIPRHCTALGVLLDGAANCQGYTDCCNMLGRMAGMDVRSQSGYGDGTPHVWNIIRVGRDWYSMDLTYDDTTFEGDGSTHPAYIYFNAGKDILEATHTPREKSELIPIRDTSDANFLYYSDEFPDSEVTYSEEEAIETAAKMMAESAEENIPYISLMVKDTYLYSYDIVDPIYNRMKQYGISDDITIFTFRAGNHTYIMGKFKDR